MNKEIGGAFHGIVVWTLIFSAFFFGHHVGKQECTINQAQEEIK